MLNNDHEPQTETIAETENFSAWQATEPDGETTYYMQLGRATINFFQEEWDEFLDVLKELDQIEANEDGLYTLEFDNVDVWMDEEDWAEFKTLAGHLR